MPFDKALNFRRHISSDITTDIPIKAKYQDGIKFIIATRYCDQADNCAIETILASGTYELDNFKPYITDVNIRYNNELLYQAVRASNEGSSDPDDGFIRHVNYEHPISPEQLLPNTLTVEVKTSEPMQNVKISYKKAGQITIFPNPVAMTKDITNKLKWTATIPTFNAGECYDVQFKGQDLSGNEVINVYAATNQNTNFAKMMIPPRKGPGVQDWNHNPTYTGEDRISFCIKDCDKRIWSGSTSRRGGDEACKALSAVSSTVLYTSCIQATIVLSGAGFNPSDFTIRWTDAQGNPLTQYNNMAMMEVRTAGMYCFEVEAIEDCCTIRGCAELLPPMMDDAAFDLSADITHSCTYSANDGNIDLHIEGGAAPFQVDWDIISQSTTTQIQSNSNVFNGSGDEDLSGFPAGNYVVVVTDKNGCSHTAYYEIINNSITITVPETIAICQPGTGVIIPEVSDGTGIYTYAWSNGETEDGLYGLDEGTYSVTLTDESGCSAEKEVVINEGRAVYLATPMITDVTCNEPNRGSILFPINPAFSGLYPLKYEWSNGAVTKNIENLEAGIYTITVTGSDGCFETETYKVQDTPNKEMYESISNIYHSVGNIILSTIEDCVFEWESSETGSAIYEDNFTIFGFLILVNTV